MRDRPGVVGRSESPTRKGVWRASAAEQLLDPLRVGLGDRDETGEATGPLGRLALEQVALAGLLGHDLAATGDPDALAHARVGLHLRHSTCLSMFVSDPPALAGHAV